jgi:hypothetical protein
MKTLYCWRCNREVPMLDEKEYELLSQVHANCAGEVKTYREVHAVELDDTPRYALMTPVLDEYRRLTGVDETDPDHVLKHRLALYGAPCRACGLPLRTARATFCAACGEAVQDD